MLQQPDEKRQLEIWTRLKAWAKGWDLYGLRTKGNEPYSYYSVEIDSLVSMNVNLGEIRQNLLLSNLFVKITLTLPLRTSTRDSHSKTSGKSPRSTQSSVMTRAQYSSCRFLIWEAVLYLIGGSQACVMMDRGTKETYASRNAQMVSIRVSWWTRSLRHTIGS